MKRTDISKTYEILGGYLMSNNELNIEYFAHLVSLTAENERVFYQERFNTRRKIRNIAIGEMMHFIDRELYFNGYENYYATNQQVMKWDREHGNGLEKVLDLVEEDIRTTREEN